MADVVAVIPARGGSKGVPRKNVRRVGGVPLIVRTVHAARRAKFISEIVVTTDDAEIMALASGNGAVVIDRPRELAGDSVRSEDVLAHALDWLRDRDGVLPSVIAFLQCTSPFTTGEDIDATARPVMESRADCAFTASRFHGFLWRMGKDGYAEAINHDARVRLRRQEAEEQYLETGAVYVMRVDGFLKARHRFFGRVVPYLVPKERSLEIDDELDLEIARDLADQLDSVGRQDALPDPVEAVVMDFDGVHTDNTVVVREDGVEAVVVDRGDGLGLARLRAHGMHLLVLSTERNPVVGARCDKLGLPYLQGVENKGAVLRAWLAEHGIEPANTVYLGNDVNDLECLGLVGCGVAVSDAHPEARRRARLVLRSPGGRGAIRELADLILGKAARLLTAERA